MNTPVINTRQELALSDLLTVEQEMNLVIPDELKNHLLKYNGGFPVHNVFIKEGEEFAINNFLAVKYGLVTLEQIVKIAHTDPQSLPSWLLPFANDAGGNHFCISLRNEDYGSIYFWDHEIAYENSEEALIFLSKSFDTFISSLQEDVS